MHRDHFGSDRHETMTRSGFLQLDTKIYFSTNLLLKMALKLGLPIYACDENHRGCITKGPRAELLVMYYRTPRNFMSFLFSNR